MMPIAAFRMAATTRSTVPTPVPRRQEWRFANTDPQWFVGEVGETMAEIRARITCADDNCSSIEPSMNRHLSRCLERESA